MTDVKIIRSTDIGRCPKLSLLPQHYREDGSCRCDERAALAATLIALFARKRELAARIRETREQHRTA